MLPLVQRIINDEKHVVTGVSPSQLIFGNALDLGRGLWKPYRKPTERQLSEYMEELIWTQEYFRNVAYHNQMLSDFDHLKGLNDATLMQ